MNIGIIVYSQTGHTESVAQKLKDTLSTAGHSVKVESIIPEGEVHPGIKELKFKSFPKTDPYEAIVFASPVNAFSLCPVMKIYLNKIASLNKKKVAFLVTKQLPFLWTGGNQAVKWMNKTCKAKGAIVSGSGIIIWGSKDREQKIAEVTKDLSKLF